MSIFGLDVGHQAAQARALHVAAGVAAVVVAVVQRHPAFVPLAGDEGQAGIALGFEAVVFLVEPFVAGFAGVDGAALLGDDFCRGVCMNALGWREAKWNIAVARPG
jgi:hypothetical protein